MSLNYDTEFGNQNSSKRHFGFLKLPKIFQRKPRNKTDKVPRLKKIYTRLLMRDGGSSGSPVSVELDGSPRPLKRQELSNSSFYYSSPLTPSHVSRQRPVIGALNLSSVGETLLKNNEEYTPSPSVLGSAAATINMLGAMPSMSSIYAEQFVNVSNMSEYHSPFQSHGHGRLKSPKSRSQNAILRSKSSVQPSCVQSKVSVARSHSHRIILSDKARSLTSSPILEPFDATPASKDYFLTSEMSLTDPCEGFQTSLSSSRGTDHSPSPCGSDEDSLSSGASRARRSPSIAKSNHSRHRHESLSGSKCRLQRSQSLYDAKSPQTPADACAFRSDAPRPDSTKPFIDRRSSVRKAKDGCRLKSVESSYASMANTYNALNSDISMHYSIYNSPTDTNSDKSFPFSFQSL